MRRTLERARARLALAALLRSATWAIVAAAVLGAALVAGVRLGALPFPADGRLFGLPAAVWAIGGALVAGICVVVAAWRRTPGIAWTARVVESHFGLSERLSTSLELGERDDAVAEALRVDAELHARALDLRGFAAPRISRVQSWSSVAGLTLLAVACLAPLPRGGAAIEAGGAPAPTADAPDRGVGDPTRLPIIGDLPTMTVPETRASAGGPRADDRVAAAPDVMTQGDAGTTGAPRQTAALGQFAQTVPGDAQASVVERQRDDASDMLRASAEAAGRQQPPVAGAEPLAPSLRNDGSTNPSYGPASTRDQELRDYARRRESAAAPGGGGGEPVALADAAVAGDATAGYEDGGGGALPVPPEPSSDLDIPDVTDPSGRRVRVERLPDAPDQTGGDQTVTLVEFIGRDEPSVSRVPPALADLDLLRRYRSAAGGANQ